MTSIALDGRAPAIDRRTLLTWEIVGPEQSVVAVASRVRFDPPAPSFTST